MGEGSLPYQIFISYRRDGGAETAKHLRDVLTERGYRVFFDTDSLRSGDFNRRLIDVIDACEDFIVILTPGSLDRCANENDWVRIELSRALSKGKNVVPVMSQDFRFPETLPEDIDALRWKNGVAVNVEYFDAMIDRLTSFLTSKPARRPRVPLMLAGAAACLALVAMLLFLLPRGSGSAPDTQGSTSTDVTTADAPSDSGTQASTSEASSATNPSQALREPTYTDYALGNSVDIFNPETGDVEYSVVVDDVEVLPDDFKSNMWEKYDETTFDLLCVYCSIHNSWYQKSEKGSLSHGDPLVDGTVKLSDEDGFQLNYVIALYHGNDGKYLFETGSTIPANSNGRYAFVFYVDKQTDEVTLMVDSHNGEVASTTLSVR